MPTRALPVALALFACACSGGGGTEEDPAAKNKMANDLIACQNERLSLKEQLAAAQAEVKKLKDAADPTVKLDPIDLKPAVPGEKHVEGHLPPEQVLKVFKANQGLLIACYEKGLKRSPNLQYVTNITAHFAVKNTGNAVGVSFTPHAEAEMEKCMASGVGKWRFPSFTGDPVQFEIPVNLVAK